MLKVGLLNHNGVVGSTLLKHLLPLTESSSGDARIHLIVFHRPSSDPKSIPPGIDAVMLDLQNDTESTLAVKVQGVEIFL